MGICSHVGTCLGADCILGSIDQYYSWIEIFFTKWKEFLCSWFCCYHMGNLESPKQSGRWKLPLSCSDNLERPKQSLFRGQINLCSKRHNISSMYFLKFLAQHLRGLSKEDLVRGVEGLPQTVTAVERMQRRTARKQTSVPAK
jgi:hypothetical protein